MITGTAGVTAVGLGLYAGSKALNVAQSAYDTGVKNYGNTYGAQHESQLVKKTAEIAGATLGNAVAGSVGKTIGEYVGSSAGYVAGPLVAQSTFGQEAIRQSIDGMQAVGKKAFGYARVATGCDLAGGINLSAGANWALYGVKLAVLPGYAEQEAISKALDLGIAAGKLAGKYVAPYIGSYVGSYLSADDSVEKANLSSEEIAKIEARDNVKNTVAHYASAWIGAKAATEIPAALANRVLGQYTEAGARVLGSVGAAAMYVPGVYAGTAFAQSTTGQLLTKAGTETAKIVTVLAVNKAIDVGLGVYDNYQKGESYLNPVVETASKATAAASEAISSATSYAVNSVYGFFGYSTEQSAPEVEREVAIIDLSSSGCETGKATDKLTQSAYAINSVVDLTNSTDDLSKSMPAAVAA